MEYQFDKCLLLNTVMAARAMTRRYDDKLRPYGISVVQFSVMGTVRHGDGLPVARLAERIAMDRTTLIRNLELLERKGLVESRPAEKGSGRAFSLTAEGDRLLDQIVPKWREAQEEIRTLLSGTNFDALLRNLQTLRDGRDTGA